jgi:hypothetical protein
MSYERDYARLVKMQDGSIEFYSSYDSGLVDALKRSIPWQERRWQKDAKCWRVDASHAQTLIDLSRRYLGVDAEVQGNLFSTPSGPVVEMLKLEYLGTAKKRDNGDWTAYGWVNGNWNAVFPLKVLKAWFAFEDGDDVTPTTGATLYAVLGVKKDVPGVDLKKAWRRAAKQWHPDVCDEPDAIEQFRRIQEAYETLSNPMMRRRYDAGLAFEKTIEKKDLSFAERQNMFGSFWYPPLRCGWVTVQAVQKLGRYNVSSILSWDDIERGGKTMVSHWPRGAEHFKTEWL